MTKIQFDSNLLPVLDAAAARSAHCGLGAVPFIAFFDSLLTVPSYMSLVLQLTHCDAAAVKAAVRAAAEKALPGFGEDAPAIADDEKIELDQRVVSVLLNAALHTYGCRRENGIIDFIDILAAALSALESSRSPLAKTLSDAGLSGLAVKLIDREAHEKDGLIDGLKLTGCDLLEDDLREMTGETDGLQSENDEDEETSEDSTSEGIPAEDMEEYREAMKKALENFRNGPIGEMIREIAQRQGGEGQISASFIMDKNGNFVQAGESAEALRGLLGGRPADGGEERKDPGPSRAEKALLKMTRDLTEAARRGEIDPLIGRDKELERIYEILCCRRKNKPLIIGETGSGKTALVEGLALRIVKGEVPPFLRSARIFALNSSSLASRYKGVFGERLSQVAEAAREVPGAILFIDDIHALVDGRDEGGMEQLNALQRLVSDESIRVIASTSFKPWRSNLSQNAAIARRLQPVELTPVTEEDAKRILHGIAPQYEQYHGVRFAPGVVDRAVTLSNRYIVDRALPDKAVDVLDELAASARMRREPGETEPAEVNADALPSIIARMARVPVEQVGREEGEDLAKLDTRLKSAVFGQDAAISAVVSAIKMSRSGLGSPERPVGSFLFTGPTGVGKTEVARQLSEALSVPLLRFDMSEYSEAHTVSRLIGAPAGYVGYNEGGLLTEQVTKHPYAVVLLDEIEKAHSQLFNLLLQVMDHGKLTDASGREADFRNVILIMTSNVGARALEKNTIGFGGDSQSGSEDAALKQVFTPEFRNRLDAIVRFAPLSHDTLASVVSKFLGELTAQLKGRSVEPEYTPAFRAWLAEKGYDPHMGARPMRRLIADEVRRPLADELLFGRLKSGGRVVFDVEKTADGTVKVLMRVPEGD
ncbi:MAG: AAA family ATPase [Sutterella sp.]|nr:AAA family ATPase [Sutterella sp.]